MTLHVEVVDHADLAPWLASLRELFDAEYLASHGPWDPDAPFGYAPADLHVVAVLDGRPVGHVGIQRRRVTVTAPDERHELVVAGTGGVLVAPEARGRQVGRLLLDEAARVAAERCRADVGYLGCREEIVDFYVACGWHRITARERSLSITDWSPVVQEPGPPILIRAALLDVSDWPAGDVDLRGRPW